MITGTKFDFLAINKNACSNKHQNVTSYQLLRSNILNISHKRLGVIGWAYFGQCGLVLDKPLNTNLKWKKSNWGYFPYPKISVII
jgi:hypothetical protein